MAPEPDFPAVETPAIADWELTREATETLFRLPGMTVRGATRRYADVELQTAVREATAGRIDREWRFVAATRLSFDPGLPPGTLPSLVRPTIRQEARRAFTNRLATRDVEEITRQGHERLQTASRTATRVTRYGGTVTVAEVTVPIEAWLGVLTDRREFTVVTGGYPAARLDQVLDVASTPRLAATPAAFRSDLEEAIRAVA